MIKNRWGFAFGIAALVLFLSGDESASQSVMSWGVVYPLLGVVLLALSIQNASQIQQAKTDPPAAEVDR